MGQTGGQRLFSAERSHSVSEDKTGYPGMPLFDPVDYGFIIEAGLICSPLIQGAPRVRYITCPSCSADLIAASSLFTWT